MAKQNKISLHCKRTVGNPHSNHCTAAYGRILVHYLFQQKLYFHHSATQGKSQLIRFARYKVFSDCALRIQNLFSHIFSVSFAILTNCWSCRIWSLQNNEISQKVGRQNWGSCLCLWCWGIGSWYEEFSKKNVASLYDLVSLIRDLLLCFAEIHTITPARQIAVEYTAV